MITALALTLFVLTAARLTRIITTDRVGLPLRKWVLDRWGADSMIGFMSHCPACMSVWIGFALAVPFIPLAGLAWWWLPFVALSASHLTILLARFDVE